MDLSQGYGGSEAGLAPPSSALHSSARLVLVACDPECQGVAEALTAIVKRDTSTTNRFSLEVEVATVSGKLHHRDVLQGMMSKFPHTPPTSMFVLSLIKDGNADEYKTVKQWTQQFKPPVNSHVITCLSAMQVCFFFVGVRYLNFFFFTGPLPPDSECGEGDYREIDAGIR